MTKPFNEINELAATIFITDAGRSDFDKQEKMDCTVRAVAGLFNVSYGVAHQTLKKAGRRSRCRFRFGDNYTKIVINGLILERHQTTFKRLGRFIEEFNSHEKVIVSITGHIFYLINGCIHDTTKSLIYLKPSKKVFSYYTIKSVR